MNRLPSSFAILAILFAIFLSHSALASDPVKKDTVKMKRDSVLKGLGIKSMDEITKSCKKFEGLFPVYQDTLTGSTYLEIRKEKIGHEYIYFSYLIDGVADAGLTRGAFLDDKIFSIQKYFNRIEFDVENPSFYFDSTSALHRAAGANVNRAMLVSAKIAAMDSAESRYLINGDELFLAEKLLQVKPTPPPGAFADWFFSLGGLSRDKTKYLGIRNYPANTDVTVEYVYDDASPRNGGGPDVTDPHTVSIKVQHSIIEVPHNNFKPRRDDPRIGYFTQQVADMTTTAAVNYHDLIHRWNLVKKDPGAALSEPVTPITYWIENTTPVEFRETIRKAALSWNIAFEAAGFKNAIACEVQPDTATWDAGDIRYNVLRWASSPQPQYGGFGPSFVNPRTGEILGADIMLEFIYMTNRMHQQKLFDASMLDLEPPPPLKNGAAACTLGEFLHERTLFGLTALKAQSLSDAENTEYMKEALYYLVMHEMGHTLGLNHNMKATQLYSPTEINDKAKTEQTGLTGSVMDYPAVNLAADHAHQGQYFTTVPGPYDRWAITYGYSEGLQDPIAEDARLNSILARSTEPALAFGNDADDMRFPGNGIDPRVMIGDMSNDAITYSIGRLALADTLLRRIKEKYSTPGHSYQELLNAYLVLTGEKYNAAQVISRYIGGVYVDRGFIGQPGATTPYTPVAYVDQKRAMAALATNVFGMNAFQAPEGLYPFLQRQRRGFSGWGNNEDPKIHDRVLTMQRGILNHCLHATVLRRISDSRMYGSTYGLAEYLDDLTNGVFKDDAKGDVNIFRQSLQREYVSRLAGIAKPENMNMNPYDYPSQAMAQHELRAIKGMIAKARSIDALTNAHREAVNLQIDRALAVK